MTIEILFDDETTKIYEDVSKITGILATLLFEITANYLLVIILLR